MPTLHAIALAIALLAPWVGKPNRARYAAMIHREARAAGVDPFELVAIYRHESHFNPRAENGSCRGLGQVCPPECHDPHEPRCLERQAALLDPATNIRISARALQSWKKLCLKKTGRADFKHRMSGYGGLDGHGIVCGQRMKRTRGGGVRWVDAPTPRVVLEVLALKKKLRHLGASSR